MSDDDKKSLREIAAMDDKRFTEIHPTPEGLASLAMCVEDGNAFKATQLLLNALVVSLGFHTPTFARNLCLQMADRLVSVNDKIRTASVPPPDRPN